jgi:hypothetical protein
MTKSNKRKRNKRDSLDVLYSKRHKALERVVAAWEKDEAAGEDELNKALDALAVAHIAATFEWASGPLKW